MPCLKGHLSLTQLMPIVVEGECLPTVRDLPKKKAELKILYNSACF